MEMEKPGKPETITAVENQMFKRDSPHLKTYKYEKKIRFRLEVTVLNQKPSTPAAFRFQVLSIPCKWMSKAAVDACQDYKLVTGVCRVVMPVKTCRVENLMHVKPVMKQNPPVGVVWRFGKENASSGMSPSNERSKKLQGIIATYWQHYRKRSTWLPIQRVRLIGNRDHQLGE
ncbi:hypothetical protein TNCV_3927311 [Trichonephila clavipes]|nr:hypothetical protein TNCV_3927311 [Trichonephila clavipes]